MADKYLSIITNFGCHFQCPYCIVKKNGINIPRTTIESLDHLEEAVKAEGANIISVSGGGDPLYRYFLHRDYYEKLFELCRKMNIPFEMHTSYKTESIFPYSWCYRVVYHCFNVAGLDLIRRHGREKVRAVFIVTKDFTPEKINIIEDYVKHSNNIDELSFRQMIDEDYKIRRYCHEYLKSGHKKRWWYIEQNDYNTYFVEGKIYREFSKIGKE